MVEPALRPEVRDACGGADACSGDTADLIVLLRPDAFDELRPLESGLAIVYFLELLEDRQDSLLLAEVFQRAEGNLVLDEPEGFPQLAELDACDVRVAVVAPERAVAHTEGDLVAGEGVVRGHVALHVPRAEQLAAAETDPVLLGVLAGLALQRGEDVGLAGDAVLLERPSEEPGEVIEHRVVDVRTVEPRLDREEVGVLGDRLVFGHVLHWCSFLFHDE